MMQIFFSRTVKFAFVLTGLLLLVTIGMFAQSVSVKGKVTNDKAEPCPMPLFL